MEKTSFILRQPDADDQRVSRMYLIDAGRAIQSQVQAIWQQMEAETFAGFTPEESVLLHQFFLRLRHNLLAASDEEHLAHG